MQARHTCSASPPRRDEALTGTSARTRAERAHARERLAGVDSTTEHVLTLWRDLTNARDGFTRQLTYVESADHRCSPPGWVGIVAMAGMLVVASPADHLGAVRAAVDGIEHDARLDPASVAPILQPTRTLGPARLFYGTGPGQSPADVIGPLAADDPRVARVLEDTSDAERSESGLDHESVGVHFAPDPVGGPGAVCGWASWPYDVAQLGVLTARASRGTGCGSRAAAGAIAAATATGLLSQWRAAVINDASIALARSLGLTEMGWQLSLDLDPATAD